MSSLNLNNLKESNNFLSILLDNINSAIFIVNKDFRIKSFNSSLKALFDKPEEKIFGELCGNALGCSFVIDENNNCGETSNCQNCGIRKSLIQSFVEKIPTESGILVRNFYINNEKIEKHFRFTAKEIQYNGEAMILVIFDDVTEIENKNIELKKLNEQKNELLGIAAHDLRNPMGVIQSFSELLLDTIHETDIEKQKELLEYIFESSKASIELMNELLDISKIEAGKLDLNPLESDYADFISKIFNINKIYAQKKNIALNLEIEENLPKIFFDKNKLEQAINNLISNAIKYSYPISSVTIKVFKENDQINTQVIDQGQGIAEKEFHKVFKEFQKTSARATGGERSTGLGLAIAKKIIEGHKGKIGFESEIGKGSTFYFKLPLNI